MYLYVQQRPKNMTIFKGISSICQQQSVSCCLLSVNIPCVTSTRNVVSLFLLPPIVSQLRYKFMAVVEDKMNCVQCPTRPECKRRRKNSSKTLWTAGNRVGN